MIKIEDVEVIGMRKAIKGMRNAMNSWDKSDSEYGCLVDENDWVNKEKYPAGYVTKCKDCTWCEPLCYDNHDKRTFIIGEADMKLCKNLIKAGSPDRKFMRMIHVQFDITAPETFLMQLDTYKVGTVSNSTSKMHTIHKRDLTVDDFSHDYTPVEEFQPIVDRLNELRSYYIRSKNKAYWNALIEQLPMSFMQRRTMDMNYETLFNIHHQRKHHKLNEWHTFCDWIETLPYMKEFLGLGEQTETKEES